MQYFLVSFTCNGASTCAQRRTYTYILQSVDAMECEMNNLKSMYDGQIMKLQQQLKESSRGKTALQMQIGQLEGAAAEFEIRSVSGPWVYRWRKC